uniref:Uncharacterized protein n=1 Tax=Anguilla anguilla TaxID=7936 RepID=A0A0E9WMA6_ANGAN
MQCKECKTEFNSTTLNLEKCNERLLRYCI